MASKKISELNELNEVPSANDLTLIVDISEPFDVDKTKKIKLSNLVNLAAQAAVQKLVNGQAAGDLFYANSGTSIARLPIGTALQVPRVKNDVSGIEYAGGGMVLIERHVCASDEASVTFSSIPQIYNSLKIIWQARSNLTSPPATIYLAARFNGDTGNNYDSERILTSGTAVAAQEQLAGSSLRIGYITTNEVTAQWSGSGETLIHNYAQEAFYKTVYSANVTKYANVSGSIYAVQVTGVWRNDDAITSITLLPETSSNLVKDSTFSLYGIV